MGHRAIIYLYVPYGLYLFFSFSSSKVTVVRLLERITSTSLEVGIGFDAGVSTFAGGGVLCLTARGVLRVTG